MRDLYDWRDIFTYANGKKKRRKGRRENQVMHISLHIWYEYANVYRYSEKKKLTMRDAAKRTHVYVKEIEVSTDECISKQTKIDLDQKIDLWWSSMFRQATRKGYRYKHSQTSMFYINSLLKWI